MSNNNSNENIKSIIRTSREGINKFNWRAPNLLLRQPNIQEMRNLILAYRHQYTKINNKNKLERHFVSAYKNKLAEFKRRSEQGQKELQNYMNEIQRAKASAEAAKRALHTKSPHALSALKREANAKRLANLAKLNKELRNLVNKTKQNIAEQKRVNSKIANTVNEFFGRH